MTLGLEVAPRFLPCGGIGNPATAIRNHQDVNLVACLGVSTTGAAATEDFVTGRSGDDKYGA